jgi:hypothetical protein
VKASLQLNGGELFAKPEFHLLITMSTLLRAALEQTVIYPYFHSQQNQAQVEFAQLTST